MLQKQYVDLAGRTIEMQELRCKSNEEVALLKKLAQDDQIKEFMPKSNARSAAQ